MQSLSTFLVVIVSAHMTMTNYDIIFFNFGTTKVT